MMKSATKALRRPGWTRWIASTGAKLPTANTIVANRISHGTRLAKMRLGVYNKISAPHRPPTRPKANKFRTLNSATAMILRRYAHAPANVPENSATTLDAFASMGLSPANRRAGNVTKVPPPASEFRAPPRNAAIMRTTVVTRCGMCVGCSVRAVNAVNVAPGTHLLPRRLSDIHMLAHGDRTGWLTMQVSCEPVSAPNSLLTGKLTGNFAESGPPLPFRRPVSA